MKTFKIPGKKIPETTYRAPLTVLQYSKIIKDWLFVDYKTSSAAWAHFDSVKNKKPVVMLNYGMILASNCY